MPVLRNRALCLNTRTATSVLEKNSSVVVGFARVPNTCAYRTSEYHAASRCKNHKH